MPDAKLGAIVIATADCANGFSQHVAETALADDAREGPAAALARIDASRSRPVARPSSQAVMSSEKISSSCVERGGKLYLTPFNGALTVEIRSLGDSFVIDDRLAYNHSVELAGGRLVLAGSSYEKQPATKPAGSPARWNDLIGEFGWDHDVLYILEKERQASRLDRMVLRLSA